MSKRLFIIDGNSFCYRAFYAISALSNAKGQPTNAVYGFIMMVKKLLQTEKPDYLGVAFDMKGPTLRHKKYELYKIHRKPMPEGLASQFPWIKKVLAAYGIPVLEKEGFEADDILGTVAKRFAKKGIDVLLVTGDKDALQLVNDHVFVYNTHQEGLIYDAAKVKEKFQVDPKQMPDLMALMGDSSDNIPGVPGIGPKGAVQMIQEFGTAEVLIEKSGKIKNENRRRLIQDHVDQIRLSKELAVIDSDMDLELDLEKFALQKPDEKELMNIFQELEFRMLLKELSIQPSIWETKYRRVSRPDETGEMVKKLREQEYYALDFAGGDGEEFLGAAFSWKEGEVFYIERSLWDRVFLALLADEKKKKVFHDFKDKKVKLHFQGVALAGLESDTLILSYLLNPSRTTHDLEDLSLEFLQHRFSQADPSERCCETADVILRLRQTLSKQITEREQRSLLEEIELPLIDVLAKMEMCGVQVDPSVLEGLSIKMERELRRLTQDIYEIAGCEFNINSPKQLSEVLFEKLKLPIIKRTKTGISTDVEVLEKLSLHHPLPKSVLDFREYSKLKSTYIDALPKLIHPKTGRIHTSYNQAVTATGRLSSSNPNLQNIPVRTEIGRQIRRAFVARDKRWVLLSADYSQIELRVLAHLSQDEVLLKAFKENKDIHAYTASLILNLPEEKLTQDMRRIAKSVNFGIIYGMSAFGLSKDIGIGPGEAKDFIDAYFKRYPKVRGFLDSKIEQARKDGFVTTLFNRRRYIPEIHSSDPNLRSFAERVAVNAPLQGTASDLMKLAMVAIDREIAEEEDSIVMILQVHDELVFEVRKEKVDWAIPIVKECMENIVRWQVPIAVDIKAGQNWLEMERRR
ncbi:MAG: DNA polymerase I [Candidatus Omnitrophica bacterium]|nr:DNA polymerase I [Candidatus Omnitrophota bacterium]